MTAQRLRIIIECSKLKKEEVQLYEKLVSFSNPGVIAKEILLGKLPVAILKGNEDEK